MSKNHPNTVELEQVLTDPTKVFRRPLDVVFNDSLETGEKRQVLERWRMDAEALAEAEGENMAGGEADLLSEVLEAEQVLEERVDRVEQRTVVEPERPQGLWREAGHKVAGIYKTQAEADVARQYLVAAGVAQADIDVLTPSDAGGLQTDKVETARGTIKDAAVGAGVGAGIGAAGAAAVSLVLAAPAGAVLAALGLASLSGLTVGATTSHSLRDSAFLEIVREALAHDCWCVIAHGEDASKALELQDVLARSGAEQTVDHGGGVA